MSIPKPNHTIAPDRSRDLAESRIWVGDCRELIPQVAKPGSVDLIFADPPFNWNRAYDEWDDQMKDDEYLEFTHAWLDRCVESLSPTGSMWVNIPDDWAAEIVMHLKHVHKLKMINWCVWHYRFGQNARTKFISSKVHVLYFARSRTERTWNADEVLEVSDRRAIYGDARTESKRDGMPAGMRLPMDVWYGQYWGRIQGNNKERRANHDNQLPEVYLERVIRSTSNPGDLVMDPFVGSGTTAVIARALNRPFIGTEYSAANAASSAARIEDGPIRLGAAANQSTAIFEKRTVGEKRQQRINNVRNGAESELASLEDNGSV